MCGLYLDLNWVGRTILGENVFFFCCQTLRERRAYVPGRIGKFRYI